MTKIDQKRSNVKHVIVTAEDENQRIDNFLTNYLKGMPKTRIYRLIRKGEIRVNKKRVSCAYRLANKDDIRLPPMFLDEKAEAAPPSQTTQAKLAARILYEDEHFIIINKPSGMSVHAGSTVRVGIVEAMRHMYPKLPHLELAHRLDSETSGCLILVKRKKYLRELHQLLREGKVIKKYWALTKGKWQPKQLKVDLPLHKHFEAGGKHVVKVSEQGKQALTLFQPLQVFKEASLMEVTLKTGRTHQIRVHSATQNHPIAGDDRYGDTEFNKLMHSLGLKRMFLHAYSVEFSLPSLNQHIKVEAPLDDDLANYLSILNKC